MADKDDYKDLRKVYDYDKEKASRLAELMNEAVGLRNRLEYLEKVAKENENLNPFLWKTLEDKVIALHDIDNKHLENIISHQTRNGKALSKELIAEAESRGISIEAHTMKAIATRYEAVEDDEWGEW